MLSIPFLIPRMLQTSSIVFDSRNNSHRHVRVQFSKLFANGSVAVAFLEVNWTGQREQK